MEKRNLTRNYLAVALVGALIGVGGYAGLAAAGEWSVLGAADGTWLDGLKNLNDKPNRLGQRNAKNKGKARQPREEPINVPDLNVPSAPNLGDSLDREELNSIQRQVAELVDQPILDPYRPEECARNFIRGEEFTAVVGRVRKASLQPFPTPAEDLWTCVVDVLPKGCNQSYTSIATSAFDGLRAQSICNAAFTAAANNSKVVMVTHRASNLPLHEAHRIFELNAYALDPYASDLDRARLVPQLQESGRK